MNVVEPVRDPQKIEAMKKILRADNLRDYVLFTLGINSGLRVSDLLRLKVGDVRGASRIRIREHKTGKLRNFPLSDTCIKAVREYCRANPDLDDGDWLFKSRKGGPLSRHQAWRIISEAAALAGVTDPIGPHSMRKTLGYQAYSRGHDLALVQKILNHGSPWVTLRYIGITRDQLDNVHLSLNL